MTFETLIYGVQEGVATIKLNRPDRHNAFNETMANELAAVWDLVKRDPEVVCAIVTGVGEKAFCTGMDVADVASGESRKSGTTSREEAPWFKLLHVSSTELPASERGDAVLSSRQLRAQRRGDPTPRGAAVVGG